MFAKICREPILRYPRNVKMKRGTQNEIRDLRIVRHAVHADNERVRISADADCAQDEIVVDRRAEDFRKPFTIVLQLTVDPAGLWTLLRLSVFLCAKKDGVPSDSVSKSSNRRYGVSN